MIVNEAGGGKRLPDLTNPAAASDMATGKQLIDQEGEIVTGTLPVTEASAAFKMQANTPSESGLNVAITMKNTSGDRIIRNNCSVTTDIPLSSFGTATAEDVKSGVTFTSADGLKVSGSGNFSEIIQYDFVGNNSSLAAIPYSGDTAPSRILIYMLEGLPTKRNEEDGAIGLWYAILDKDVPNTTYTYGITSGRAPCTFDDTSRVDENDWYVYVSAGYLYIHLDEKVGVPSNRVPMVFDVGKVVGSGTTGKYRAIIFP